MVLVPNILRKFGWYPAQAFLNKIKEILKDKTGMDDITFRDVSTWKQYSAFFILISNEFIK